MSASPRSKAIGAVVLLGLVGAMCAAILVSGSTPATATDHSSLPASKAAVAIDRLIELSTAANDDDESLGSTDTGWVDILSTQIKTSEQKDLLFDAALQCGLITDTTVASKNGQKSTSEARASIAVRVLLDKGTTAERIAEPTTSEDAMDADAVPGVVYCDRLQKLEGTFAGLECTTDPITGEVTCPEESLQVLLQTMNANSFNFALTDVGSGVHTVTVQAWAHAEALVDEGDDTDGSLAGAEAFTGAGSLAVQEVRLVKDAQIIEQ